jgi:hypothetical protein
MDTNIIMMDFRTHSGYTSTLPHTWRVGSIDVECSKKTVVMILGKGFGE